MLEFNPFAVRAVETGDRRVEELISPNDMASLLLN